MISIYFLKNVRERGEEKEGISFQFGISIPLLFYKMLILTVYLYYTVKKIKQQYSISLDLFNHR